MNNNQKRIFYSKSLENALMVLPEYKPKILFKYQLFLHAIIYQQTYKKLTFYDFVPINKNKMIFNLGNNPSIYYHIRALLLANNLIEVQTKKNKEGKLIETYSSGVKSKQYRINKNYIADISTKIITNDYIKKIKEKNQKLFYTKLINDEDAFRMYQQYKYLKIDEKAALIFCDSISDTLSNQQYKYHTFMIKSFNQLDETFFTWENPGFRHYTRLTNLSKHYRKFLFFDKSQNNNLISSLINIDIRNSQPLLFNILIKKYLETQKEIRYNGIIIHQEAIQIDKIKNIRDDILDYNSLHKIIQSLDSDNIIYLLIQLFKSLSEEQKKELIIEEWNLYKKETEKGSFYDSLISQKINRSKFKKTFFKYIFFGRYWKKYMTEIELKFLKKYPLIYSIINSYKLKDYKQLSIQLQKEESNLIIRNICKKINMNNQDIFLATIHDSILCEEKYKEIVLKTIEEEFRKINLHPSIAIN